jgi:hypothetical protein
LLPDHVDEVICARPLIGPVSHVREINNETNSTIMQNELYSAFKILR